MVLNVAERWGRLQSSFAAVDKTKLLWRMIEWLLALAGPIVAYHMVLERWESKYYNKWGEIGFALVLLIPMVGPALMRLFSGSGHAQKRIASVVVMVLGAALAIKYRPPLGGLSVMGSYVPMALYALAAVLWIGWRNNKLLSLTAVPALVGRLRSAVGWRSKKLPPLNGTRQRATRHQTQA